MQMRGKPVKVSGIHDNVYRDTRRKSDRPRYWSWQPPKRSKCVRIPVSQYLAEQQQSVA
jgi:hypothetical protein